MKRSVGGRWAGGALGAGLPTGPCSHKRQPGPVFPEALERQAQPSTLAWSQHDLGGPQPTGRALRTILWD